MFKKISVFLVLVLVIGALSACSGSALRLPNKKKAEIEDTWYAQYAWDWFDENNSPCRYYGKYQGYDIIFHQNSFGADVIGTQRIAGIEFPSGSPFELYGYRNGKLYLVSELYEAGKLSVKSIAAAAKIHNSENKTLELSERKKKAVEQAWIVEHYGLLWNSEEKQKNSVRYYGSYDGYDIVYYVSEVPPYSKDYYSVTIANTLFEFDCASVIFGFRDGQYTYINKLYEDGLLSEGSVAEIAEVHQRSERKEAN